FRQEELQKVGAILSGNSGNQRSPLRHGRSVQVSRAAVGLSMRAATVRGVRAARAWQAGMAWLRTETHGGAAGRMRGGHLVHVRPRVLAPERLCAGAAGGFEIRRRLQICPTKQRSRNQTWDGPHESTGS